MINFHGRHRKKSYFEGWYIKHQSKTHTIAFIPAYHVDAFGHKSVSLQMITNSSAFHFVYPIEKFSVHDHDFYIQVGNSIFQQDGCHIDIRQEGLCAKGDILYHDFHPLKKDIMGPFRFVPRMQCSHGVISMGHKLFGNLEINGSCYCFDGGAGYIETDRGSSFPKEYLWTQCNCFQNESCSIMVSAADIPFGPTSFRGCISSVCYHGKEYRLATYTGCHVDSLSPNCLTLHQGQQVLKATLLKDHPIKLHSPVNGLMKEHIYESAVSTVRYEFFDQNQCVFDLTSEQASFEYTACQIRN